MPARRVEELLILTDNLERRLRAEDAGRERNQIDQIVQYMERISPDGAITALANHVAIELFQRNLESPFGSVAVIRALAALEQLKTRLLAFRAEMASPQPR